MPVLVEQPCYLFWSFFAELAHVQVIVEPFASQQLFMLTSLDDLTLVNNQ